MKWEDLAGDDRIRYCGRCRLNVYNLAEMRDDEVERIVRTTKGRICGRLYLRGDRTATLRSCPEGDAGLLRRRFKIAALAIGVVLVAILGRSMNGPDLRRYPGWLRTLISWIDPSADRGGGGATVVGAIAPPKGPGPLPAPPTVAGP